MLPGTEDLLDFYPFPSWVRGVGVADVYHSHPACQIGQSIAATYRFLGNPYHWPECPSASGTNRPSAKPPARCHDLGPR